MENKIKNIAIIGLGLIGGSIAKALKQKNYTIVGIDKNKETIRLAKKEKVINQGFTRLSNQAFKNVDVIFIATLLNLIPYYLKKIARLNLKKEIIVTDVGSTKTAICKLAKTLFPSPIFIGGHPMAGTEKAGFKNSQKKLFQGRAWILTPTSKTKETKLALEKIKYLIKKTGSKPIITSPEEHDKACALISHLPLVVSVALCSVLENLKASELKNLSLSIASSGFRDTTRIASCNPAMNSNLMTCNINEINKLIPIYYKELKNLITIANKNPKRLKSKLIKISKWRSNLITNNDRRLLRQS